LPRRSSWTSGSVGASSTRSEPRPGTPEEQSDRAPVSPCCGFAFAASPAADRWRGVDRGDTVAQPARGSAATQRRRPPGGPTPSPRRRPADCKTWRTRLTNADSDRGSPSSRQAPSGPEDLGHPRPGASERPGEFGPAPDQPAVQPTLREESTVGLGLQGRQRSFACAVTSVADNYGGLVLNLGVHLHPPPLKHLDAASQSGAGWAFRSCW